MDDTKEHSQSKHPRAIVPENMAWLVVVTLCQFVAYWDAAAWLYRRIVHSAGDLIGMIAVIFLIMFLATRAVAAKRRVLRFSLRPIVLLMLIYGASYYSPAPPIVRAAIACISLFLTVQNAVFGHRPPIAYWGMILFALPILPSLQFYLGFPARLISASLTVPLLRMNGLSVHREGTYLVWRDQMIQFDAPCSGVTMLWAGVLLTFFVAYLQKFTLLKTIFALVVCSAFILIGNVLRAGSLFYIETGVFPTPAAWWHEAIGVMVFTATSVGLIATLLRLDSSSRD